MQRSFGVNQRSNHLNIALGPPNLVTRTPDRNMKHCWVKGHAGVIRGQSEVNLLRNALLPPNSVGRTPDRIIIHCRGQRSSRGHPGSTRVNLLRIALWPPNSVGRTPDRTLMHCWDQRSCRGHPGSTRGQIAYDRRVGNEPNCLKQICSKNKQTNKNYTHKKKPNGC